LLGLPTPRISEFKIGKGRLSPNQRQIIIDNYGYPRRGKGQYLNAEIYNSATEFIGDYEASSKQRLKRRLYSLFTSKEFQDKLSSCVELTSCSSKESSLLYCIDDLLSLPETKTWYESIKNNSVCINKSSYGQSDDKVKMIDMYILQVGLSYVRKSDFNILCPSAIFINILYRIAGFKYELMSEFSFNKHADIEPVVLKELVITGDIVLELKPDSGRYEGGDGNESSNIIRRSASLIFNTQTADFFGSDFLLYELMPRDYSTNFEGVSCKPDHWERIILRLYLSESMNYHLWIRLDGSKALETTKGVSEAGEVRNIVIKTLSRIDLLSEMELIRKWCGYAQDMNADIKHEIAKLGGYIPGAEML
jgi:hypothetical protein